MDEFAAALGALKAFNRMVMRHPELSRRLIDGEHHFLQWRQGRLYVAFREYHRKKAGGARGARPTAPGRRTASLLRALSTGIGACLLTAWAVWGRGKKDVLIFSVDKISADKDHDFRLDGLYRFLKEKRLAFTECFHTELSHAFFRHARARGRAAVYREAFGFLAALRYRWSSSWREARRMTAALPCLEFEEEDRAFVRQLVQRLLESLPVSRFEIRCYRLMLRCVRPKAVLAIDDTRYYQELCAAARTEGIPLYAFQHGHFTKYHAGWLSAGASRSDQAQPSALFVWSPYWKNELVRLGTYLSEETLRVGGNPKGDPTSHPAPPYAPPSGGERLGLLVPFESDVVFEEVAGIIKKLLATGRIKIWLKTRPDWTKEAQLERYGLKDLPADQAEAVPDHNPVLSRIHAVAGVYSTFLYDALSSRKPVFLFKTSMDMGEGMVMNGLADWLDSASGNPAERLVALCREAAPKLEERLVRYAGGTGKLFETLERLTDR